MDELSLVALAVGLIYLGALACIYRILLTYRTTQGAIAWIIGLLGLPYLAVPMFALFGRYRFGGYVKARRLGDESLTDLLNRFEQQTTSIAPLANDRFTDELQVLCRLGRQPFTDGNRCTLLRDGEATFDALFEAMEDATSYILLEFYIIPSNASWHKALRSGFCTTMSAASGCHEPTSTSSLQPAPGWRHSAMAIFAGGGSRSISAITGSCWSATVESDLSAASTWGMNTLALPWTRSPGGTPTAA